MKVLIFGLALLAVLGKGFGKSCDKETLCTKADDETPFIKGERCFRVSYYERYPSKPQMEKHEIFLNRCEFKIYDCETTKTEYSTSYFREFETAEVCQEAFEMRGLVSYE